MKKLFTLVLALTLALGTVAGCSKNPQETASGGSGETKGELIVAQSADAKTLDPHAANDGASSNVMTQIYDTLVVRTPEGEILPSLAESWEQLDEKTWQFKLAKGIKFHNGEELQASDVKFTFERAINSPVVSYIFSSIESVEVVDTHAVNIRLIGEFSPILAHLAHNCAAILNEKAVTEAGEDYGQKPVGTGPYILSDRQMGDSITLAAYESYFKGVAPTAKITYRSIPESANRSIALETGEVDIAYDIDAVDKDRLRSHDKVTLIEQPSLMMDYLGLNINREPFNDVRVRQAINYAIDRDGIVNTILMGAAEPAGAPLSSSVVMCNPSLKPYSHNVEKAKELMKEAGLENGFKTTIWINDTPQKNRTAQVIQANLKEIGIEVGIEILEWGTFLDRTAAGEHNMLILGWTTTTGDPDYGLSMFHSTQMGGAGNRSFYSNATVDEMLDLGKAETDAAKRQEYYYEAQEIIYNECPVAPLYYPQDSAGVNNKVSGFELHPSKSHRLYGVTSAK